MRVLGAACEGVEAACEGVGPVRVVGPPVRVLGAACEGVGGRL